MPKPFKTIVEELRGIRQQPRKYMNKKSHIAPEGCLPQPHPSLSSSFLALPMIPADGDGNGDEEQQSPWAHLPPELILDIIKRVETTGTCWPGRRDVVVCAAVCRSWRDIVSYLVKTPQQCGLITFPISLKQPGPKEHPIQCLIRRERSTSTYRLYIGLGPGLSVEESKLLLSAKKIRRVTCLDFIISLVANDYSRASSNYVGKLRSNFLGTKFTIFDNQSSLAIPSQLVSKRSHRRVQSQQFTSTQTPGSCLVTSISYELNVLRTRGPRRMNCTVHSIPMASLQEGGTAPTPTTFSIPDAGNHLSKRLSLPSTDDVRKSPLIDINPKSPLQESSSDQVNQVQKTLVLKNKAPRWHEQLQCWCLNFKGRVTVASVKNFQLVASVEPEDEVPPGEQEKVILQFGKIGKDIFTMDYRYPLSAFQAFAICLTSFDTKPACE